MTAEMLQGSPWIDRNWMFFAPLVALPCLWRAFHFKVTSVQFLAWALLPIYTLHQFEENAYDVFGQRYAFADYFNGNPLGVRFPPRVVTVLNMTVAWIGFPIAAWRLEALRHDLAASFAWAYATFNGVFGHLLPSLLKGYNPGSAQSLLMVPIGVYFLRKIKRKNKQHGIWVMVASVMYAGPFGHGLGLLVPIKLFNKGRVNEVVFTIWMLFIAVLPVLLAQGFALAERQATKVGVN
mmetsp:Transcript_5065/g.8853  ORF Transcript_5065/g.8853 Transcript_5065/m.8853 type:complete len:237 (+) Transcript_5065:68-778(+)